jgi:hypothetical protein
VEIFAAVVAAIVPVLVAAIVPVLVAAIVPVLVAAIVPDLAKAFAEKATTNMPAKAMDLTFFIVLLLVVFESSGSHGRLRGSPAKPILFEPTYYK